MLSGVQTGNGIQYDEYNIRDIAHVQCTLCTHAEKTAFSCKDNYSKALHIYEPLPTKQFNSPPQKKIKYIFLKISPCQNYIQRLHYSAFATFFPPLSTFHIEEGIGSKNFLA